MREEIIAKADGKLLLAMSVRPVAIQDDGMFYFVGDCAKTIVGAAAKLATAFAPDEQDQPHERGSVAAIRKIASEGVKQQGDVTYLAIDSRTFNAANNIFGAVGLQIVSTDLSEPAARRKFSLIAE